ncbi:MAG TPA: acyl-CoA dehydrogenase, partial [Alphaproteobacteria bacterium]|nr:acyl-CoA dehydrogenase [Alphaproteobacteria bacterium]
WLITGARGAGLGIIMARTGDKVEHGRGATMFLTDMDRAGIEIVRDLDTLDRGFTGGHSEILLNDVRIPASDILGEIDEGYRYAQVRLGPARLTHCMRWLGAMNRAHDTAVAYAARREGFGRLIGHHEGVGFQLADNEMDIHMARLVIWQAAWALDNGSDGRQETAMAKVLCSEAAGRVVDRSLQVLGGLGITSDTVVSRIYRDVRPFRIYDGPSEVHRWSIAERLMRQQRKKNG